MKKKKDNFTKVILLKKGGRKMEALLPGKAIIKVRKADTSVSPWLELQEWCSDFAKKTDLTYDEAAEILAKVRVENEGSGRY